MGHGFERSTVVVGGGDIYNEWVEEGDLRWSCLLIYRITLLDSVGLYMYFKPQARGKRGESNTPCTVHNINPIITSSNHSLYSYN